MRRQPKTLEAAHLPLLAAQAALEALRVAEWTSMTAEATILLPRSPEADRGSSSITALLTSTSAGLTRCCFVSPPGNNPGNNLHVSGLHARVEERDLEDLFSKYGRVSPISCQSFCFALL